MSAIRLAIWVTAVANMSSQIYFCYFNVLSIKLVVFFFCMNTWSSTQPVILPVCQSNHNPLDSLTYFSPWISQTDTVCGRSKTLERGKEGGGPGNLSLGPSSDM